MTNYIALLRGVNVAGKNKLPMAELRDAASEAGLQCVTTYIQSGNLLFQSSLADKKALQTLIQEMLVSQFSIDTHTIVLSDTEFTSIFLKNPFGNHADLDKTLQLYILANSATNVDEDKLNQLKSPTEKFYLSESCFYLLAPDGIGRSKLAASAEKTLGVTTTTRNWRTTKKLLAMLQ